MKPTSILQHDPMVFKKTNGFDYPEFYDYYEKTVASPWRHQEVSMDGDLRDWQFAISEPERTLIAGVLKGFVSAEIGIGCYWSDVVRKIFPKPEIQAMATAFSYSETVHAAAYSYLNDVLGLNEYEEFIADPIACDKIATFFDSYPDKVSLAVFSGAGEGVSLFSSFAILLAFSKTGRFKGLAQLMSWSAIDEQTHSEAGCALFRRLIEETGLAVDEETAIYRGFDAVVEKEFSFIDHIFDSAAELPIDKSDLKQYILQRANNRLALLGLQPRFIFDPAAARHISEWFDPMIKGRSSTDFFASQKAGGNYIAKPHQNFDAVDLSKLILV